MVGLPVYGGFNEQRYPLLSVCAVCVCVQTMVGLPVYGGFNEQRYPLLSVCAVCVCPNNGRAASVWVF